MNSNVKLGLTIVASVIIGLAAFRIIQSYIVMKQVENITTDMAKSINKSAEKSQQRMQAMLLEQKQRAQQQQVEAARIKALTEQRNLEKNLLCAKNVDTNKCSCYDKRDGQVVNMSVQECNGFVDRKSSSY